MDDALESVAVRAREVVRASPARLGTAASVTSRSVAGTLVCLRALGPDLVPHALMHCLWRPRPLPSRPKAAKAAGTTTQTCPTPAPCALSDYTWFRQTYDGVYATYTFTPGGQYELAQKADCTAAYCRNVNATSAHIAFSGPAWTTEVQNSNLWVTFYNETCQDYVDRSQACFWCSGSGGSPITLAYRYWFSDNCKVLFMQEGSGTAGINTYYAVTATPAPTAPDSSLAAGAIAGIVLAALAVLALAGFVAFRYVNVRRGRVASQVVYGQVAIDDPEETASQI